MPGETAMGEAKQRVTRLAGAIRRIRLVLLTLVSFMPIAAAFTIGPLVFAPNHYEHVASIEKRADFRSPALMEVAWNLPVSRSYTAKFEFQDNPSFCGPASVANLLRSIGKSMSQHQVIDDTPHEPWLGVLIGGMTIDEVADLLKRRTGRQVSVVRDLSLPQFRALIATANDPRLRMIVNFHRGPIFGRGHGHFSPVLAYLSDQDLVLVGDVNSDYRPFLVPVTRLWQATDTINAETGKERGMITVEVGAQTGRKVI